MVCNLRDQVTASITARITGSKKCTVVSAGIHLSFTNVGGFNQAYLD